MKDKLCVSTCSKPFPLAMESIHPRLGLFCLAANDRHTVIFLPVPPPHGRCINGERCIQESVHTSVTPLPCRFGREDSVYSHTRLVFRTIRRRCVLTDFIRLETISRERERGRAENGEWSKEDLGVVEILLHNFRIMIRTNI